MSSKKPIRRETREAFQTMRKEVGRIRKDLASATETWVKTTEKFVQEVSPKVSSTIDEALEKTSMAFHSAMTTIDKQTNPQQAKLLRGYKSFLSKQIDLIEKRLKKLAQ